MTEFAPQNQQQPDLQQLNQENLNQLTQQDYIEPTPGLDQGSRLDSPNRLPTEIRRKYPKDIKDRKSEWEAIEYHKNEINRQLQNAESEIKNYRQKELLTELDRKMVQMLEQKHDLLLQKKDEALKMQKEREVYNEQQVQMKQDKKFIGQLMGQYYNQQRSEQLMREAENKNQKLNWEKRLIEYNRERLESEQRRQREHKQYLTNERLKDIQRAQDKKNIEKQIQAEQDQRYKDLMQANAERELTKEENYKNFYKMTSINQNQRHNQHFEKVLKPHQNRNDMMEDIINKNFEQANRQREEDELQRLVNRKQIAEVTRDQNLNQIQNKYNQKQIDQIEREKKVQERLSDLEKYNQYLKFKREEKLAHQRDYKNYLEIQANERQEKSNNQLRMTKPEKQLNRLDLQAYKQYDDGLYSMIPGWSPQIGQLPPQQNREKLQNQIQQQLKQNGNTQMGTLTNWKDDYEKNLQKEKIIRQNAPQQKNYYQKIGEPLEKFNASAVYSQSHRQLKNPSLDARSNSSAILSYGHNPLTNPMPYNVQNPYIIKEFQRAHGPAPAMSAGNRSNLLSQAGENTLPA